MTRERTGASVFQGSIIESVDTRGTGHDPLTGDAEQRHNTVTMYGLTYYIPLAPYSLGVRKSLRIPQVASSNLDAGEI